MSEVSPSSGYWPSAWPAEDAGPLRQQVAAGAFAGVETADPQVVSRDAHGATMVVRRDLGEVGPGFHRFWKKSRRLQTNAIGRQRHDVQVPCAVDRAAEIGAGVNERRHGALGQCAGEGWNPWESRRARKQCRTTAILHKSVHVLPVRSKNRACNAARW